MVRVVFGSLVVLAAAALLAGCSNGDDSEVSGAAGAVPALKLKGNAVHGNEVWIKAGCNACHTFSPANAKGKNAPNLDKSKPTFDLVATRVTLGLKGMPTFKRLLTNQQIADVAEFVSSPPTP